MQDKICTHFLTVLKQEVKGKSIAFVPKCTVTENSDKTLSIHYDFSKSLAKDINAFGSINEITTDKLAKAVTLSKDTIEFKRSDSHY